MYALLFLLSSSLDNICEEYEISKKYDLLRLRNWEGGAPAGDLQLAHIYGNLSLSVSHFLSRPDAMAFTALIVSVQVGLIRDSGRRKPKYPVSLNSKANAYGIPFL